MLLLPLSAELKLNKLPVITYGIILLCIFVFYSQWSNRLDISRSVNLYCDSIQQPNKALANDDLTANPRMCRYILSSLQNRYRDDWDFDDFINQMVVWEADENPAKERLSIERHYLSLQGVAPQSLDMQLMHYPDSLNPLPMLTSSLAHGNFGHIFFNLLFFLAFAPVLEILINNRWKFSGVLLAISLLTALAYSVTMIGSFPVPTLGLSGVVMGMIGMSAYMIPKAKIRVVWWLIVYVKMLYIPAWIVAAWYIGWDIYELYQQGNNSGINLVAHVSGGIAGYLLAMLWFKERREEYSDELEEEIETRRHSRLTKSSKALEKVNLSEYNNKLRLKKAAQDDEAFMQKMYGYVSSDRDSDAVVLMLDDYENKSASVVIYEELFERVEQWKPSRTLLCIGRVVISLLASAQRFGRAIEYVERCQKISKDFVLANPDEVILLVQAAIKLQKYQLAYNLVKNSEQRYKNDLDFVHCQLLEIELLWMFLNETKMAEQRMKELLMKNSKSHQQEITQLAMRIKNSRQ